MTSERTSTVTTEAWFIWRNTDKKSYFQWLNWDNKAECDCLGLVRSYSTHHFCTRKTSSRKISAVKNLTFPEIFFLSAVNYNWEKIHTFWTKGPEKSSLISKSLLYPSLLYAQKLVGKYITKNRDRTDSSIIGESTLYPSPLYPKSTVLEKQKY